MSTNNIYSYYNDKEVFQTDNIMRWLKLPYQRITLEDLSVKRNGVLVVSVKQFNSFDEMIELLKNKFDKVIVINDDNSAAFPQQIDNFFILGYELKYNKKNMNFTKNEFNFNYVHCRVAFEKTIIGLPDIVNTLKDRIRNKYYTNLNRYPKIHRLELMEYILENNYFDLGYNSFVYSSDKVETLFPNKYKKTKNILPVILDLNRFDNDWNLPDPYTNSDGIPYQYTLDSYLQLVTETQYEGEGITWTSEKIVKPFVSMNFMLLLAQPGTLTWWKNMGFETFDFLFDESYDTELDDKKRLELVFSQLKSFVSMSLKDINNLYYENFKLLEHNYNHYQIYANNELNKVRNLING